MASLLVVACGADDEGPATYDEGRTAVCRGFCDGLQRCGLTGGGCESACVPSYDPRGIRPNALVRLGDCLKQEPCSVLASDEAFVGCAERVAATEPVRDALLHYCESAVLGNFNCHVWWEIEACTEVMSLWEDTWLERAERCHALACDEQQSCEEAAFEGP